MTTEPWIICGSGNSFLTLSSVRTVELSHYDLEQYGGPVEVNICQMDHTETAGATGGTYLAPSTVVVVERTVEYGAPGSVPVSSNAIQLTSAPPSPLPSIRNTERQRNGGHRGIEEEQSKRFITRFNFGLRRVRSAARRHKKSSDHPRGGAHNAQKRERKATKTLAIVLGSYPSRAHVTASVVITFTPAFYPSGVGK